MSGQKKGTNFFFSYLLRPVLCARLQPESLERDHRDDPPVLPGVAGAVGEHHAAGALQGADRVQVL